MRTHLYSGLLLAAALLAAPAVQAQEAQDAPAYQKEFTYGINLNTNAGLIGGVAVRSTRRITDDWARFWLLEGVEVKGRKEQRVASNIGGVYVEHKTNYLFVLRPTVGVQRSIFRKAAESGISIDGLFGVGPSVGLLLPYYIYYDYTDPASGGNGLENVRAEQYDPAKHDTQSKIVDRAPILSGIKNIRPNVGAHLRGALNFEYGRYRDAVAGVETGFVIEAYTKRLITLEAPPTANDKINNSVFSSMYLTLYIGQRK